MQFIAPYRVVPSMDIRLGLHPDHLADLRASGLTDETIRAAGVYSLRPHDLAHFFSWGVPAELESALCFPYQRRFGRIKLFPALGDMKYAQPRGTGARLYVPFPARDGEIIVAEGEKKSLAAYQLGLNAIGIGGVWNWLSDGEPIDELKIIDWNRRDVTIIPDSDVFLRFDLLRAIYALGRELQSLGANVLVAEIPQRGPTKVGLDDYLVSGGVVGALEVFALSHRVFKSAGYWHARWKMKAALAA
jgi:putative DNA primase/helicase